MANAISTTCLEKVIGLADASCICSEDGRPADYSESKSGRYLADYEYGLPMSKLETLSFGQDITIWQWLAARRKSGIRAYLGDLALNIPPENRVHMQKYAGFIGDIKEFSYALSGINAISGIGLHPVRFRGVKATINGVRLWYPGLTSGIINFHLSTDLLMGNTTPHYAMAFSGNTGNICHVNIPTGSPLIIDLADQYGEPVTIWITLENDGNMPLNTRFYCGSCGIPSWSKFFHPRNVSIANYDTLITLDQARTVPYGAGNMGIAVDLVVECSDAWICSPMDYSAEWPRIMAEAIQLYGQRDVIQTILKMEHLDPNHNFNRDEYFKQVENINALLAIRMPFLGTNVPLNLSDCLICEDRVQVMENII